ncbi:uncharacterized protein LOC113279495 [Papaver somniferum]|uniref:uncharacterized protein LOC113279495 n=1 Tax=Papaver somniferum TaxID=3469 RepID=UPI000E700611|nr:uncharacterized protein LOC113279495 [Papaver somniferum]
MKTRIPLTGLDRIVWTYTRNGSLTVKSVYRVIISNSSNSSFVSNHTPLYKKLWSSPILHKVQIFIWKCFEYILPSKCRLAFYCPNQNTHCSMCNDNQFESEEHIIFNCRFVRYIWALVPHGNLVLDDMGTNISISDWIRKWLLGNYSSEQICHVFTTAWCIWKERCYNVFQDKQVNHISTTIFSCRLVNETLGALSTQDVIIQQQHIIPADGISDTLESVHVDAPLVAHFDASFDLNTHSCGIDIILTNSEGNYKGCKTISGLANDAEEAESMAALKAVKWIKMLDYQNNLYKRSAENVISYLNKSSIQISWCSSSILDDCLSFMNSFSFYNFVHVRRELNGLADKAAKHSRKYVVTGEWG